MTRDGMTRSAAMGALAALALVTAALEATALAADPRDLAGTLVIAAGVWFQGVWALLVWLRPRRELLIAGLVANALLLAICGARLLGVNGRPVVAPELLVVIFQATLVAGLAWVLVARPRPPVGAGRLLPAAVGGFALLLAGSSMAMAGPTLQPPGVSNPIVGTATRIGAAGSDAPSAAPTPAIVGVAGPQSAPPAPVGPTLALRPTPTPGESLPTSTPPGVAPAPTATVAPASGVTAVTPTAPTGSAMSAPSRPTPTRAPSKGSPAAAPPHRPAANPTTGLAATPDPDGAPHRHIDIETGLAHRDRHDRGPHDRRHSDGGPDRHTTPDAAPDAPVPTPRPTPQPTDPPAIVPGQPGVITFGTNYDHETLSLFGRTSTIHSGELIAWRADLNQPAGSTTLTFTITEPNPNGPEFPHWQQDFSVPDPSFVILVNRVDLSVYVHGDPGSFIMRIRRGPSGPVLAEGRFSLVP